MARIRSDGSKATLKCIDPRNGGVKWSQRTGFGGVTAVGDTLLVMSERGELIAAKASPQGYTELARAQVIGGKCWTIPTVSNGRIYVRNQAGRLVCLDLSGG